MAGGNERIFVGLNAEWALVCAEPAHAAMVRGWLEDAGVLAPGEVPERLEDVLAELERRDRSQGRAHSDRWLAAVLAVAAGAGREAQLAARVVVQAMLSGAFRLARRLMRAERDFDEVGQVVVAALYQVVRTYPAARQRKVAANLMLETLHRASRELQADFEPDGVAWQPELAAMPDCQDVVDAAWRGVLAETAGRAVLAQAPCEEELSGPRGELIELLAWGVSSGMVDAERARAIADEVREGGREAAEQSGVSAVAWRKRRSRTVRQLRAVAESWAQAA
ncbi:hypothetical protein [Streptomyces mirabilis]|uniref:DNA-directed RNA polymerase specialized sigma subunit, sigma24 family n=1 Tax=Streptomyces mirabilis TaxID=68239 RepID=A0ABU3V4R5_9ACTN|nr:hypothetical protein [Streptomyces mirabilis]MCX5355528.1 hypothetical protein [Streptomyces mirabilis]MDU9001175.1 hypothetical protein [Streptomyces mirabilis]